MATTGKKRNREPREIDRHLISGLARGINWLDNSLQNVLRSQGFNPVHRTQSLILLHIACGIEAPADIAREMGLTRQNVHQMARSLIENGLIEQSPDPADPRRTRYQWTKDASGIRSAALDILSDLETVVQARAGASDNDMRAFRRVLATDWGPSIADHEELLRTVASSRKPTLTSKPRDTKAGT